MIPKICPLPTSSSRTSLTEVAEVSEVVEVPKEVAIALNLLVVAEEVEVVVNPIAKEDVQDSDQMSSKTKKAVKINKTCSRPRKPVT
jgi:hypothetical protein